VGAGLRDCLFWAIIVGGTRPYKIDEFLPKIWVKAPSFTTALFGILPDKK
jgi:hypothetical protein